MHLSIQSLSKGYANGVKAIDDLSLEIGTGMFGLLGPNGAGKSSLMRTIATLQKADSGRILFNGRNIFDNPSIFRRTLGYLPQEFGVYPKDSAEKLLHYFATLKGINSAKDRIRLVSHVLELTNLWEVRKKRVSAFSGGMRQRFGIAQLLLNQPELIIVDEPTAGLDPAERARFLNVLRNIGSSNIVIFSTHLVEDVAELCSEMAIMDQGKRLAQIAPKEAIAAVSGKIWEAISLPSDLSSVEGKTLLLRTHYNEKNERVSRVYADVKPSPNCVKCAPKLEDYYFLILNSHARKDILL
ncbi:MAG: ABC transporter ATP-binding protein [Bacteroidota bacterium]